MKSFLSVSICMAFTFFTLVSRAVPTSGGVSDGGGNTYHGKPLESYAKNPTALPSFQQSVLPILNDIQSKESRDNRLDILRNLMTSVFNQKIWYFVPGPLDKVPPDLLNSAVRTDQAALQGFDRVWIDEDIWSTMSLEDQGKLLLHETFMGLKILKFASSYRQCKASDPAYDDCFHNDQHDYSIALTSKDYVEVQTVTIKVSAQYLQMSNPEWMQMINQNGFKFGWDWFDPKLSISRSDFKDLLKKSTLSGFLPTQGYNLRLLDSGAVPDITSRDDLYKYLQENKKTCGISAEVNGSNLNLKLNSPDETFDAIIPIEESLSIRYNDLTHRDRYIQDISFRHIVKTPRPTGGFTMYNIHLGFDLYKLAVVLIQEMVCQDETCYQPEIDVKGGMAYYCVDDPQFLKP